MSDNDIKIVEETLKGLMISDNAIRRVAEIKLEEFMINKSGLVFCLSNILLVSQEATVRLYAAVVIRKLLEIKENEIVNPVWSQMDISTKLATKQNSLAALIQTNDKNLKFKICEVIISLCENCYENEEEWKELLHYIVEGFKSELTESNLLLIETSVYLLSKIFGYVYEELSKGIDLYVSSFKIYFASNDLSLRTKTVQAIGEILCIVRKKDSKKFKDFIIKILETTLYCLDQGIKQENNLKLCISSIADLSSAEPNILRKSFPDLFILMGKIIEKNDYGDDTIRELAFEIIITMIEKKSTLISKDPQKLKLLIEVIYKYALEIEDDVSDEWLSPKTDSYFDEEFIPEEKLETALSLIDRLTNAVGSKMMLSYLSDIVLQLLNNECNDWKFKYIGFMTISQMVEYVDDIVNIENILDSIFKQTENSNPKIRYSCLHCISQIADHLNPQFQNNYHEKVFPVCLARVSSDPVLRVRLQACDALQTYIEFVSDQIATLHSQSILDTLFSVFIQSDSSITVSLRESILNVTSELVTACAEGFTPYAEKCLTILLGYFSEILKSNTNKSLYGMLLDAITVIGPKCKEVYIKYLPDLTSAVINIQNNIPNTTDPVVNYLHNAWERLIPLIKEHNSNAIPQIIESVLKLTSVTPTMSLSSQPEKKFDIQDLLSCLNENESKVTIEKKKVSISTSETEDFAGSLELLNVIIETFAEMYYPYVEITQKQIIPLLNYEMNADVRAEASNCLPELLNVVKKQANVEILHSYAKLYLSELIQALEKENDNSIIATLLDNIGGIVEKTGLFLITPEINILFDKLLHVFDNVEKSRLTLLHKKDLVEDELIKDKNLGDNKIYSDDENDSEDDVVGEIEKDISEIEEVLVSIADVMGSLFNTHKELTLEIVQKLLNDYLPKYFTEKSSNFEKKMGLFILDDMTEFLGQTLLEKIWGDIAAIIIRYADSKETELRQAACYGIGEFSKHTIKDYNLYVNDSLVALSKALDFNSDGEDEEEWGHARDNTISALGKIIKFQNIHLDVTIWIPKWLNLLPLQWDAPEGRHQHLLLCEILLSPNSQIILGTDNCNLPRIIRVLAKIYDTSFSDEVTDKNINLIFSNIKQNPALHEFVKIAKEGDCEKTIAEKLNRLFG